MNARGLVCALSLAGCLPSFHDLEGRRCSADTECGEGLVCHRSACAKGGTFDTVPIELAAASSEGGVSGTARAPTRPGLTTFFDAGALASARAGQTVAGSFVIGAEVLGPGGATTPLPSPRTQAGAALAGGRLFVLGGLAEDGTPRDEVVSAPLLEDGGVGAWEPEPALPSARAGLSAIAAGGYVYALGGEAATGLTDEVLASAISGSGRLGPWRVVARLPEARARGGAALFDGRLHLAGGACAGACTTARAPLLPDGGVGAFEALAPLAERESPAVALAGGALHVLGGRRANGQVLSEVWSLPLSEGARWQQQPRLPRALQAAALVEDDGALRLEGGRLADGGTIADRVVTRLTRGGLDPFASTSSLPTENEHGRLVEWNGALYSVGGAPRTLGPLDAVYRSEPAEDGGLTPWTLAGRTPRARGEIGAAAWGGRLYLVAGCENAGGNCLSVDDIYAGDFLADGGVGNFRVVGQLPMGTEGSGIQVAVSNGWLYMVGGVTGYNPTRRDVLRSRIDVDTGGLSPPAALTPLSEQPGLWGHGLVASRGHLYVVGGQTMGGFGGYSDRVLAGRIAPDGTVSSWGLAALLPEERTRVNAVGYDDTLYVVNGCNEVGSTYCGSQLARVFAAALLEDGGVGPFTVATSHPEPRSSGAAATLAGRLVIAGGYDGNPQDFVESAVLHGRGRLGPARTLTALPAAKVAFAAAGGRIWAFGADGSVHVSLLGGPWEAAPSVPSAQLAASTGDRVWVASGTSVWSAAVPVSAWREEPALPAAATAFAGTYAVAGTALYFLSGVAWQAGPALPVAAHRLVVEDALLFALSGDTGEVFVSTLGADGAPGPWRRAEGLPGPRRGFAVVARDGMLYAAGGAGMRDVLVSSIRGDGTLGAWSHAATLPGPQSPVGLVAESGLLFALSDEVIAWPLYTPPSRGAFSVRVDLGSAVGAVEGITLEGEGRWTMAVRLAGDDGVFGDWLELGAARAGQELLVGKPARWVWLRVTLLGESRVTSGRIATKL